jgi:uncharacterized protein YjbI with pentapeptide repeats
MPGTQPLQALAAILARIAENDLTPVKKTREFAEELTLVNRDGEYDGLQRIASLLPEIATLPLIVLVDQFEEVYSLCKDDGERDIFIANLLQASGDRSRYVSVILTMRSDFLGETQKHPTLNRLFSTQGFLVPTMDEEALREAIAKPAELAGSPLDKATVDLLIEQTEGREGALPLLQFALTRIWEGLRQGVAPAVTLAQIGGVGGALAGEAQRVYDSLSPEEQAIARRVFLGLVQLGEEVRDTRRRAHLSELIASDSEAPQVRGIIARFAANDARFLTTSLNQQYGETIEVTHEALIRNWSQLRDWLNGNREALRQKQKIEQAAAEWNQQRKSKDYLLQGRFLRDAKKFLQDYRDNPEVSPSRLATELVKVSTRKQISNTLKSIGIFFIFFFAGVVTIIPKILTNIQIDRERKILYEDNCNPNPSTEDAIRYMLKKNYGSKLTGMKLCEENLPNIDLSEVNLSQSDLRAINLGGAILKKSVLVDVDLKNAILINANLSDANLQNSKAEGAKLSLSTLTNTIFKDAKLSDADLRRADLTGADLTGADLTGADLTGADLTGATLRNTDLRYANGISIEQLKKTKILCGSKIPQEILEASQEIRKLISDCTSSN